SATHAIDRFADGVFFVALASLTTAEQIPTAIAEAISYTFSSQDDQASELIRWLAQRQMCLVLDNFEHVLGGFELVDRILAQSTQTKVLVTSRERLNLQGE